MVIVFRSIVLLDEPGLAQRKLVFIEPIDIFTELIDIDIRPVGEEALINGEAVVLEVIDVEVFGIAFEEPGCRPAAGESVQDGQFAPAEPFRYILKASVQEGKKAPFISYIGYKLGIEIGGT
jgi:hypothetical protein